jgi:DNA-binding response OmpR family regulator
MADCWIGNARAMNDGPIKPQKFVLTIDDESEMLEIIKQCLESEGFQVLIADSPKKALEIYEERWREIGLVLLDYLMPGMTGDLVFECLQRINADVRVLLLTAYEDRVARTMFETGLRGFIQKPFYVEDLVQRVREELDQG